MYTINEELLVALLNCILEVYPEGFKCDTFEIDPFDYDDKDGQYFSYYPKDLRVDWYKHPGRSTHYDENALRLTAKDILLMGIDCYRAMGK